MQGASEAQIRQSLEQFVAEKLKIPTGDLCNSDINYVRRTKSGRKSKVKDEVVVSFTSTAARDLVQSHARNLAEYVGEDGKPLAGIRMEVPERLMADFKALEQYGHAMREKHGKLFKRHIKLDDATLGIYLDVFIPRTKSWVRVDVGLARADNLKRQSVRSRGTDRDLLTTDDNEEQQE